MPTSALTELVHPTWAAALEPVSETVAGLGRFLREELAAGRSYLPAGGHVLRAFEQPLGDVRVLIVGQDPYPTPGHAVGLSFAVAPDVRPVPRSLQNIYTELGTDLGRAAADDRRPVAVGRAGVMLLNRVLTVRPAHRQPPRQGLGNRDGPGDLGPGRARRPARRHPLGPRGAVASRRMLGDVPAHRERPPLPLSARSGFFGSRPFSRANELLAQQGAAPIDWRLT